MIYCLTAWVGWAAADWRRWHGRPKFAVHIDATEPAAVRDFGHSCLASCRRRVERGILGAADQLFAFSHWAANSAINDCGVPAGRVCVIPFSVATAAEKPRLDEKLTQLIFIGNDWQRKGGPTLLQIHQQRLVDRAVLHIVSAHAPIDAQAKNVVWHGAVPNRFCWMNFCPRWTFWHLQARRRLVIGGIG